MTHISRPPRAPGEPSPGRRRSTVAAPVARRTTVKINGTATLNAPRDRVWAALNDPAVLVRTIPGVERLEAVGA
ncbi:MAG: SRPBCC domain-containing protein, partial [Kineosporiaceae bacterium]